MQSTKPATAKSSLKACLPQHLPIPRAASPIRCGIPASRLRSPTSARCPRHSREGGLLAWSICLITRQSMPFPQVTLHPSHEWNHLDRAASNFRYASACPYYSINCSSHHQASRLRLACQPMNFCRAAISQSGFGKFLPLVYFIWALRHLLRVQRLVMNRTSPGRSNLSAASDGLSEHPRCAL